MTVSVSASRLGVAGGALVGCGMGVGVGVGVVVACAMIGAVIIALIATARINHAIVVDAERLMTSIC
jgi:uncharacterized membrane protein YczE